MLRALFIISGINLKKEMSFIIEYHMFISKNKIRYLETTLLVRMFPVPGDKGRENKQTSFSRLPSCQIYIFLSDCTVKAQRTQNAH